MPHLTDDFYALTGEFLKSEFRGTVADLGVYEALEKAARGDIRPGEPILIKQHMGYRLYDFLWVEMQALVHDRVIRLMADSGVTGWRTYPVSVVGHNGKNIPDYSGLTITGRCGFTRIGKGVSSVVYEQMPGGQSPRYKGLSVSVDTWDGSDIFVGLEGTGYKIVTKKVRDLYAASKVTNVTFKPIQEILAYAMDLPDFPNPSTSRPPQVQ